MTLIDKLSHSNNNNIKYLNSMRKLVLLALITLVAFNVNAQKKEKLKGNKTVTDVYKTLSGFNTVEISDNLKVTISQTGTNGYHLLTDENLVNDINFVVIDSVLKISTTSNITSSKKLEIDLNVQAIDKITVRDDVKLFSSGRLNSTSFTIAAFDKATFKLDINANSSYLRLAKGVSGEITLVGDKSIMIFDESSTLKGDVRVTDVDLKMNGRSTVDIAGELSNLTVVGTDSATLKGEGLKTADASINLDGSATVSIQVNKLVKLYSKDRGTVYLYGSPEIKIDGFQDKSQLIKK